MIAVAVAVRSAHGVSSPHNLFTLLLQREVAVPLYVFGSVYLSARKLNFSSSSSLA